MSGTYEYITRFGEAGRAAVGKYLKFSLTCLYYMSLSAERKTVNETRTSKPGKRFICNADFSDKSVELVIHCDSGEEHGFLTVWNDHELIANRAEVDVDIEGSDYSIEDVAGFFDQFLMGQVNQYIKDR